ncbi:hypothetical protein [Bacillus sp. SJS]|uniref:hypothetical protein n=1 Tax=Bacillus sp. SJS TaxID=1423321 RepID=UPI0004DCAFEA|nr:hypothetical protein [Bacillus sp. SJS]KZZ83354.1 hypothetical protein AS29_016515 [Bacillus sp. SJS]
MKISGKEKENLSEAIDQMNEALDVFIQIYNQSEEDKPILRFTAETEKIILKAIEIYGEKTIEHKINTLIKEFLSFTDSKTGKANE